jgi:hypothetical protein
VHFCVFVLQSISFLFCVFCQGVKPRALHMLDKHSVTVPLAFGFLTQSLSEPLNSLFSCLSATWVLGLQMNHTTPGFVFFFLKMFNYLIFGKWKFLFEVGSFVLLIWPHYVALHNKVSHMHLEHFCLSFESIIYLKNLFLLGKMGFTDSSQISLNFFNCRFVLKLQRI